MGPWYQKVNAAIAQAKLAQTEAELRQVLGEPNETIAVPDDDRIPDGETTIDPRYPERILVYRDPYRSRIAYRFDLSQGRVIGFSKAFSP